MEATLQGEPLRKLGSVSNRNDLEIIANFVIILKFSENLVNKREGVMIEMLKPAVWTHEVASMSAAHPHFHSWAPGMLIGSAREKDQDITSIC